MEADGVSEFARAMGLAAKIATDELAELRAEVEFQASLYRDASAARDKHWKALQDANLQIEEARKILSKFTGAIMGAQVPGEGRKHLVKLCGDAKVFLAKFTDKPKCEHDWLTYENGVKRCLLCREWDEKGRIS